MAKRKVNKSAAIRELYARNPKLPVSEAVKQLAAGGIKVAPSQVYFVLGGARGKAKRKRRAAGSNHKAGNKVGSRSTGDPVALLVDLKALAERAGGMRQLARLVEMLAE